MALRLYNTLTRRDEELVPLNPPIVTFYSCGPTVYDFAHIGNFRSFLAADLLRRYLDYSGYQVRHVMNMTDVGHMVDDSVADGAGEDKMTAAQRRLQEAKKSGTLPADVADIDPNDPYSVADFYAGAFIRDSKALGLKVVYEADERPELLPRPSRYVKAMIELVSRLIERGHAYQAQDGVVYFDVHSFPEYGRLSGNTPARIRSGAGGRVDESTQAAKRHPADFLLWKPDPTHLMRWPSPWGEGYPGWHLECSVMAADLLGRDTNGVIDLHSGGEDNIFPHHECEIAQSRGATGADHFARHWFHPRHLFVEGAKMSKSAGTFFTLQDVLAKGYEPAAIRFELIKTHYRSNANFTFQGLKDSTRVVQRWRNFLDAATSSAEQPGPSPERDQVESDFSNAMDADLNVAGAIGIINSWVGSIAGKPGRADADLLRRFDSVLGVLELDPGGGERSGGSPAAPGLDIKKVESLLAERSEVRKAGDFARADAIRDEMLALGVQIKDTPDGTTWARRLEN